jgi:hypothetical protein
MSYRRSWTRDFDRAVRNNPDWPVVVSHGDSWFSFEDQPNVIDVLDDPAGTGQGSAQRSWSLLRMENGNDEVVSVLAAGHRAQLRSILERYPVNALLFSGGLSDLLAADFGSLLRPYREGATAAESVVESRLVRRLRQVEDAYRELFDMVLAESKELKLFVNSYDYPPAQGRPARLLGSKLSGPFQRTAFRERGYPEDSPLRGEIPRLVLDRFCEMLDRLAGYSPARMERVETRGAVDRDWADELHPNAAGARRVAGRFAERLAVCSLFEAELELVGGRGR